MSTDGRATDPSLRAALREPPARRPDTPLHEPPSAAEGGVSVGKMDLRRAPQERPSSASLSRSSAPVVPLPIPISDTALVNALRERGPGAGALLFDRYGSHVHRVVARVLGPDSEIRDLVQEVFVAALTSIGTLRDPHALEAWLTRVAVYRSRARIRRRRRWRFVQLFPSDEPPETAHVGPTNPEVSEALRRTYAILETLPTDQRIAFALRFIEGMELTEVAEACNVSLATIKRRLRRAQDEFMARARQEPALAEWVGRDEPCA